MAYASGTALELTKMQESFIPWNSASLMSSDLLKRILVFSGCQVDIRQEQEALTSLLASHFEGKSDLGS